MNINNNKKINIKGTWIEVDPFDLQQAREARSTLDYTFMDLAFELANDVLNIDITEREAEEIAFELYNLDFSPDFFDDEEEELEDLLKDY